jgi:ATPase subunit of ABC transporter with duplicated ATPase domains
MVDEIVLSDIGKRFNGRWLFRHVHQNWKKGDRVAVIGSNGSGKSSFTSIISGYLTPSEGNVALKNNGSILSEQDY